MFCHDFFEFLQVFNHKNMRGRQCHVLILQVSEAYRVLRYNLQTGYTYRLHSDIWVINMHVGDEHHEAVSVTRDSHFHC